MTDEGRTELVAAVTERTETSADDQVGHALAQFRSREASRHDKQSAAVTLALVLEERRHGVLEDACPARTRAPCFRLPTSSRSATSAQIRNPTTTTSTSTGCFWLYLATVELTNRILAQQRAFAPHGGSEGVTAEDQTRRSTVASQRTGTPSDTTS